VIKIVDLFCHSNTVFYQAVRRYDVVVNYQIFAVTYTDMWFKCLSKTDRSYCSLLKSAKC